MVWLKGLKKTKEMLRNERWPKNDIDGFNIGISLMASALEDLKRDIWKRMPGANKKRIQQEIGRLLIHFHKIDQRWIERYKKDHKDHGKFNV